MGCALHRESSHFFLVLMALVGVTASFYCSVKTLVSLNSTRYNVLMYP